MTDTILVIKDGQSFSTAKLYDANTLTYLGDDIGLVHKGENIEHAADDGIKYANILAVMEGVIASLSSDKERSKNIVAIGGTCRGAVLDIVGHDERPIREEGIQTNANALTPKTHEALDDLMPLGERWQRYLLPGLTGGLEPARTLVDWVIRFPELLKKGTRIRALDQLMIAPLVANYQGIANEPGASAAYLGCHTGLKGMGNPEGILTFSELALKIDQLASKKADVKLIGGLIPNRIYTPADFVQFQIDSNIAKKTGLINDVVILPIDHDTTGEEAVVKRIGAQEFGLEKTFVSTIFGSWFMDRVVPGEGSKVTSLEAELCGKGILGQTDFYGNPVKTVLTASGDEFKLLRKGLEAIGFYLAQVDAKLCDAVNKIIKEKQVFFMQGRGDRVKFASQFPGSKFYKPRISLVVGPQSRIYEDANTAYAVAMLMAIAPKVLVREMLKIGDDIPYILSGGAANTPSAEMFASAIPNPVYNIIDRDGNIVTDIGDISTLIRIKAHLERKLPEQLDISGLNLKLQKVNKPYNMQTMREYCMQWCEHQAEK